jgi:hypothetical protein
MGNSQNLTQLEENLKEHIRTTFEKDFRIHEEVEGEYVFEGEVRKVVLDFVLAPKPHLIDNYNFPKGFLGIETKHIKDETIPEMSNLYIQCLTYKNTKFKGQFPFAVFHYTNLNYIFHPETKDSKMHEVLSCTFGRINIGRLEIDEKGYAFIFHKNEVFFQLKNGKYKPAKRPLLKVSFGSGNNKLKKEY